ncbi:MBL fold metallo-hydrolase [Candidatus Pacearchaeota archaeon]|nr:MBL fold metallo-hydrolase [Candidatus Pacearchaeota archaeon]
MRIRGTEITTNGHASFLIEKHSNIYIDPYHLKENPKKADIILITHSHHDHCSLRDLKKIVKENTIIIATPDSQSRLLNFDFPIHLELIEPGEEITIKNMKILAVPAYNTNKSSHKKENNYVGFLINTKDLLIYHSGDTDVIPEMQKLTGYKNKNKFFIAILPIGGKETMSSAEAVEASKIIKPDLTIPMHHLEDNEAIQEFQDLCEIEKIDYQILQSD